MQTVISFRLVVYRTVARTLPSLQMWQQYNSCILCVECLVFCSCHSLNAFEHRMAFLSSADGSYFSVPYLSAYYIFLQVNH